MIIREKGIFFLHPPKVGGNTIHNVLNKFYSSSGSITTNNIGDGQGFDFQGGIKHWPLHKFYKHWPEIKNYYKFSVIRNPWDRISSLYHWFKSANDNMSLEVCIKKHSPMSFTDFFTVDGSIAINDLICFENFESELRFILEQLSIDIDTIPIINKSANHNYVDSYKNSKGKINYHLVDLVESKYKKDFQFKKYYFGE